MEVSGELKRATILSRSLEARRFAGPFGPFFLKTGRRLHDARTVTKSTYGAYIPLLNLLDFQLNLDPDVLRLV